MNLLIPLNPIPNKNNMQLFIRGGKPCVIQSERYRQYEHNCGYYIKRLDKPINYAVNVKAIYYRSTKRRIDLVNLHESLLDILVRYGILADDESSIVVSLDGSRVRVDKSRPRTEIIITNME